MDVRQQRAEQILAVGGIVRQEHIFWVPSQSGGARHSVMLGEGVDTCDCLDFEERQRPCKHILAAKMWLDRWRRGEPVPPPVPPERIKRKTYPQNWPQYNLAQINEKDHFQVLLADLCATIPEPSKTGKGRKPIPLRDGLFSAIYKVYSTFSARRFMCDLEEAHRRGHVGCVPCFNSVLNALDNPAATPILLDLIRQSALPLRQVETKFAADATGFMTSRYVRWFDQRYGTVKVKAEWVKCHIICGVQTNIIAAAQIMGKQEHEAPRFPELVDATAKGFRVEEVSVDAAYPGRENFDAVAAVGGTLYAMFKSNTTGSVGGLYEQMFHLFCLHREAYLKHYHLRSNVESTFSMVKRKHGDALRSKTDTAMANEALAKLVAHNICCLILAWYELGIEPVFGAALDAPRDVLRFPKQVK